MVLLTLSSCIKGKVCQEYRHIDDNEWTRSDTVVFSVGKVKTDALCQMETGIRLTTDYPYSNLSVTATTILIPDTAGVADSLKRNTQTFRDTILITPYNEEGDVNGSGIRNYQLTTPFRKIQLHQGDSLHITLRHNMRLNILPGVNDVGMIITEESKVVKPLKQQIKDNGKRLKIDKK